MTSTLTTPPPSVPPPVATSGRTSPTGAANWRDVGGLPTADGREVLAGRLFRSDTVQDLTTEDVRWLTADLGVRTVLDLRHVEEAAAEGSGPLAHAVLRHHLPLVGEWGAEPWHPVPDGADRHVVGYYLSLLERSGRTVGRAVRVLAQPASLPAVVHCAAGKDRTGVLVALVLAAVGVPDDAVAAEYALTTPVLPAVLARLSAMPTYAAHPAGLLPEANRTEPQTMLAFLGAVRSRHGSVAAYLSSVGVGIAARGRLRRLLTS